MKKKLIKLKLLLFFLLSVNVHSQKVFGVILNMESNEPINGGSVYFDSTTIGTTTNEKGEFNLNYNPNIKSPLVISYMGFQTIRMSNFNVDTTQKIYLSELSESLNEITLNTNDGLSRSTKLKEFRKHFLGNTVNGKSCEILNEEDLILRFNITEKQLTAQSNSQIIVKNNRLKYLVYVDLSHFEINYSHISKNKKNLSDESNVYFGSFYFKSFAKEVISKETSKKRNEAYEGSILHFMRSLSKDKLQERGFDISEPNRKSDSIYLKIDQYPTYTSIALNKKIHIKYRYNDESSMEVLTDKFYIDSFGNHTPPDKVRFAGEFGKKRIGDLLPLDYSMENLE